MRICEGRSPQTAFLPLSLKRKKEIANKHYRFGFDWKLIREIDREGIMEIARPPSRTHTHTHRADTDSGDLLRVVRARAGRIRSLLQICVWL